MQTLENIQKILELPILKVKEVHQVRWLSFFEALSSVQRTLPALISYFQGIDKRKDPKGEGMARKICTYKFVYLTHLMLDVLAPNGYNDIVSGLSKERPDLALIGFFIERCKSDLMKVVEGHDNSHLKLLETDIDTRAKSYKNYKISTGKLPESLVSKYVETIKTNLEKRLPEKEIINAYSALGMRPISMVDAENLNDWGNENQS